MRRYYHACRHVAALLDRAGGLLAAHSARVENRYYEALWRYGKWRAR